MGGWGVALLSCHNCLQSFLYLIKYMFVSTFSPSYVSDLHICLHHLCVWYPRKPEKGTRPPGAGVTDGYKLPPGCWASNLGSLQKQHERLPHGQISSTPEIFTFNKQAFALSILQSTQEIWLAHASTSRNYSAHERRQTQAVKITPTSSHLHGGNKKSLFILELIN